MPEEQEKKHGSRKILAAVLISAAVLGGGGYGIYHAVYGQPQTQSASVKKAKSSAKDDWFKPSSKKTKKQAKKAAKQESAGVKSVIEGAFPASVLKTVAGDTTNSDGLTGVLLDNGLDQLASDLNSNKTQDLVALADNAVNTPTTPDGTTTPAGGTLVDLTNQTGLPGTATGTTGTDTTGTTTGTGTGTVVDTGTGSGTVTGGGDTGSGTTTTDTAPTISAPSTISVHKGQGSINLMSGVSASDAQDGNLTSAVTYSTTLDKNTPGTYSITYSVTDSAGHTASVTSTITVINDKPSIAFLDGNRLEVGGSFDPLKSVMAADFQDGNLTSKVTVDGRVDTSVPGDYHLTYSVTDSDGQTVTKDRTITVYADAPTVINDDQQTSVAVGGSFNPLDGVNAESKYGPADLKVDGSVDTSKPGANTLTYTATDKFGQTTTKTVTINVTADAPTIDVSGVKTNLTVGDSFDENAGVTATSPYGEAKVTVDGSVDTSTPGTYTLHYTATDKFGQTVKKDVTVTVAAPSDGSND